MLLLGILSLDGQLSRIDGAVLLLGFVLSVIYLLRLSKRGFDIKPTGEVAETLEEAGELSKWKSFGLLLLSLAAIIIGSEMLVAGSETIIVRLGLSDTVFGMTILAFFLFNAGIIALVSPVTVGTQVLRFYLPLCFGTVIVVSLFMMTKKIPRWAGGILVLLYLIFIAGGYI